MRNAFFHKFSILFCSLTLLSLAFFTPDHAEAMPGMAASNMGEHFNTMDADGDGKLSRIEFYNALPQMRDTAFDAFDADGDGFITMQEWAETMSVHMGTMPPKDTSPSESGKACPVAPDKQKNDGAESPTKKGPDLVIPPKANP